MSDRDARIAELEAEVAARDAVIENALIGLRLSKEPDWPGWNVLDGTERILSAASQKH